MTTDLFVKKALRLLAPRPTPVAVNVQMSSAQGLPVALPVATKGMAPPPLAAQPADVNPAPAKPFLEDIPTRFRFGMQQISIGGHSTSEMGGKHERSGSFVDGR